jgi:AraC-like DNA-binding protein
MSQVWDISVLVDGVGRILEVRGQAELHLGQDGRGMIGQPISKYITSDDAEHFQSFFRKLGPSSVAPRCLIHLTTPAFGVRSYVMQAEPSGGLESYWLLFAAAGPGISAEAIKDAKFATRFTDDERMMRLIEMVAAESEATLDLTVIAIAALRDRKRRSQGNNKNVDLLEAELEAAILDLAEDGAASKSGPGEFSVLHKPEKTTEALESNIQNVAERLGFKREELGLASRTVEIEPGSTGATIRAKLAYAYEAIREDIDEFDRTATPVDMMKVVAFAMIALVIGGVVGAVLAYMP